EPHGQQRQIHVRRHRAGQWKCLPRSTGISAMCRETPESGESLPLRQRSRGFTLAELVVTIGVLVVLVLLGTQLLKSAATVTTLGPKQMDADSQARQLLDRMTIHLAQLVKRNDLDFFAKGTIAPNSVGGPMDGSGGQTKNDRLAFYSAVPGYYPATGEKSPV